MNFGGSALDLSPEKTLANPVESNVELKPYCLSFVSSN
jgi:hypothetical protein